MELLYKILAVHYINLREKKAVIICSDCKSKLLMMNSFEWALVIQHTSNV